MASRSRAARRAGPRHGSGDRGCRLRPTDAVRSKAGQCVIARPDGQPHFEHVIRPRFSRARSTRRPQRMQFAPPSSSAKGSAKCRGVTICVFGFEIRGLRRSTTAAVPTGGSAGSATGCAGWRDDGSHGAMTCTVGHAGSGARRRVSCGGRGGADLARDPSGHVSARTFRGAGRGRPSVGLGLPRRTWTTSTTLLLVPPNPLLRGAVSMRRLSPDEVCAPCSSRRGNS
jgi:hypothetical protein